MTERDRDNRLEMFNNMNNGETMKKEEIRKKGFLEKIFKM